MNPAVDTCPPLTVAAVDLNVYLVLEYRALAVARETARLCWQNIEETGGMYESYHPETGKGFWAHGLMSWNVLADVMVQEIETGEYALRGLISVEQAQT